MTINNIRTAIENTKPRSAWDRGVKICALELLEDIPGDFVPASREDLRAALLNGARDWKEYSWGGCALVYDEDIAVRLCTPSELKKTRNGERRPNPRKVVIPSQCAHSSALRAAYGGCATHSLRTYGVGIPLIDAKCPSMTIFISTRGSPGGELPEGQERPPWGAPACGLVRDDRSFLTR